MTSAIHGPGILWVQSRLPPSSLLTESTFLNWYDTEHIPDVVATSGIHSAFRFVDLRKTSASGDARNTKPFLAVYAMPDLAFTLGDEFRRIRVKSDMLPGSGVVYDLAELDVSYLGVVGGDDHEGGEGAGNKEGMPKYMLSCGIRPNKELKKDDADAFFAEQASAMNNQEGCKRTLSFELQYARTNAQSRKLKGLPSTDEPEPEPSTWLKIYQFEDRMNGDVVEEIDKSLRSSMEAKGWGDVCEVHLWELAMTQGEGRFFN